MQNYRGDITDLRVVRRVEQHPQAWRVWQPVIIQGQKKRHLIVAFGAMVNGKKDMGDILATLSTDDGDTWEEPVMIFDHRQHQGIVQFAYANPVLYRAPGQDVIWCFAMRCPIAQKNSEESQLVGAFTADGGYSWTQVEMAMHYAGPLITCSSVVTTEIDSVHKYLLPAHRNTLQEDPRGSRDHFVLSSTSLLEWKLEAYIPQPTKARVFLHEGNIAPGETPEELWIVMRTADYDETDRTTDPPRAYSSVSRDGGRTWSVAKPEPDLHNAKSKAFFGRSSNGTHISMCTATGLPKEKKHRDFPTEVGLLCVTKQKIPETPGAKRKPSTMPGLRTLIPHLLKLRRGTSVACGTAAHQIRRVLIFILASCEFHRDSRYGIEPRLRA